MAVRVTPMTGANDNVNNTPEDDVNNTREANVNNTT
jgi:hypothetical protein